MSNRAKIDNLLRNQSMAAVSIDLQKLLRYAESIAQIENVVAVVSDIRNDTSKIYSGRFGAVLGVEKYCHENSIWEKSILDLMTETEQEEKFLAELRFFSFLRHIPRNKRANYYLASKLRVTTLSGEPMDILHRMYYIYSEDSDTVYYALCLYGCLTFDFAGKSIIINTLAGTTEELSSEKDSSILSKRERQILKLIDYGKTSVQIADALSISKNTVSRHRQDILAKLQVRNSIEACKIAKAIGIL